MGSTPRPTRRAGGDVLGATGHVVNWVLARREVDYLAEDSLPSLVQHYWSLSVEEQFYVVWPLLIIAVLWASQRFRLRFRRILTLSLGVLILASLTWSVVHTADSPGTAYFVTTTRIWQLGVGALLVLLTGALLRLSDVAAHALAWAGLAAVGATIVLISTATPWPGSAALLPTLGTASVIAAGITTPDNTIARLLDRRPMRWLGALSYGLYLWHWPALRILAELHPDASLATRLAVATLSVLLAWASLHLVENPVRFNGTLTSRTRHAAAYGAVSMLVTGALGVALLQNAPQLQEADRGSVIDIQARSGPGGTIDSAGAIGLVSPPSRTQGRLDPIDDPRQIYTRTGPTYPAPDVAIKDIPTEAYDQGCQVDRRVTELPADDACWFGDPEGTTTVAVVGDSKMLQWLPALEQVGTEEGWRIKVLTKSSCGFADVDMYPECHDFNRRLSAYLADGTHTPDIVFTSMVHPGGTDLGSSVAGLLEPVQDAGAQVVVVADNPAPNGGENAGGDSSYLCVAAHPTDFSACDYQTGNGSGYEPLKTAADQLDVPFVDLSRWICPPTGSEPACPLVIGKVLIFRQGSHLTATYVQSLAPILHHELIRAGIARTDMDDIRWQLSGDSR